MTNGSEVVECLQGLHEALRVVIEAASETILKQEKETALLRAEIKEMHGNVDYWKYQLEIRGIDHESWTDHQINPKAEPSAIPATG